MTAPDLDPDLLKAFLAVAEYRSFTRAADQLNRTQSAVSVQVRRLEERSAQNCFSAIGPASCRPPQAMSCGPMRSASLPSMRKPSARCVHASRRPSSASV
jgi:hypothetical protein